MDLDICETTRNITKNKTNYIFRKYSLQVFIKSELKVGVIFVKEGQYTEEEILDNNENSALFNEFLQILGDRVRLKGKALSTLGYTFITKEVPTTSTSCVIESDNLGT